MNCRYFGCPRCKTYTDAGYRWAYWLLEKPGLVVIGEPVSVDVVLSAEEYWNPPVEEESKWLVEQILPRVKQYLAAHRKHGIIYIEDDLVFDPEGLCADWVEVKTAYIDVAPRKR